MNRNLQNLAVALGLMLPFAAGATTSPITFCPEGTPGSCATAKSLDWAPNSTLSTAGIGDSAVIPWAPSTTKDVQTVAHGALGTFLNERGTSIQPACISSGDCEITFVVALGEKGTSNADTSKITFPGILGEEGVAYDPAKFTNTVHIFFDDLNDGSGSPANPLAGTGYVDGTEILSGVVVDLAGSFTRDAAAGAVTFDQSDADDWGILTIAGTGSQALTVLITGRDAAFFPDINSGSLMEFNTTTQLPYEQQDPSMQLAVSSSLTFTPNLGDINGASGPDFEAQTDANSAFTPIKLPLSCRVTGGGNDTSGILIDENGEKVGWDSTMAAGGVERTTGNKKRYTWWWTMGGQAGANTGKQPQPKGEWEHQNRGEFGDWGFHAGTASGIRGTEVDLIVCSDEGWCKQARPAPTKQIDFEGAGNFNNMPGCGEPKINPSGKEVGKVCEDPFVDLTFDVAARETLHWYDVHIEDLGEPGNIAQHENIGTALCPKPDLSDPLNVVGGGSGTDAFATPPVFNDASCECPDYYRIRIYDGMTPEAIATVLGTDVESIYNGKVLTDAARDVLRNHGRSNPEHYTAEGYIDGGNFQIHPPTGFDLKQ